VGPAFRPLFPNQSRGIVPSSHAERKEDIPMHGVEMSLLIRSRMGMCYSSKAGKISSAVSTSSLTSFSLPLAGKVCELQALWSGGVGVGSLSFDETATFSFRRELLSRSLYFQPKDQSLTARKIALRNKANDLRLPCVTAGGVPDRLEPAARWACPGLPWNPRYH